MSVDNTNIARIFKALCDENRIAIIELLQTGEKCACEIGEALNLAQSRLSYHMKILCESGLIESWYMGKWTHYKISESGSQQALDILSMLTKVKESESSYSCCDS